MNYLCAMTIQEKIKETREAKRLSQYDMADKLGISQSAYLQIEKGKTDLTINRLYQIAEILEVNPLSLMGPQHYATETQMKSIEEQNAKLDKLSDQNQKLMQYLMYFIKLNMAGEENEGLWGDFRKEIEETTKIVKEELKKKNI